jgi:hypothetical protein
MSTPFEEIEQLADLLPEEGEALLVSRRDGELVCEPFRPDAIREGLTDAELYGRLVQANERLDALTRWPLWVTAAGLFLTCTVWHLFTGISWRGWYVDVGLTLIGVMSSVRWIHSRQLHLFRTQITPMLDAQTDRRDGSKFALIGAVRQHTELRTLMDFLVYWDV